MPGNPPRLVALAARLLLPLGLVALSSCDIEFPEQEVHLKYDAAADTLDLLLVYHGVTTPSDDEESVAKGVEACKRLLQGEREFMLIDWPLYFEIDKWEREAREELSGEEDPYDRGQAARYLQVAERITLVSHGLFLDGDRQLDGYQLFRVREFSHTIAVLNQMISAAVLNDLEEGGLKPDDDLDERTVQLVTERAKSGGPWFGIDDRGITVDLPFSLETTRKGRRALVHELLEDDDSDEPFADLGAVLAASITTLSFERDRAVGVIAPDLPGRYDWTIQNPHATYSTALLEALRADGVPVREDLKLDQVHSLLR